MVVGQAVDVARARAVASLGSQTMASEERGAVHVVDVLLRVQKGTADTPQPKPLATNGAQGQCRPADG